MSFVANMYIRSYGFILHVDNPYPYVLQFSKLKNISRDHLNDDTHFWGPARRPIKGHHNGYLRIPLLHGPYKSV